MITLPSSPWIQRGDTPAFRVSGQTLFLMIHEKYQSKIPLIAAFPHPLYHF